jgi:SAM-dependent methyltransferase
MWTCPTCDRTMRAITGMAAAEEVPNCGGSLEPNRFEVRHRGHRAPLLSGRNPNRCYYVHVNRAVFRPASGDLFGGDRAVVAWLRAEMERTDVPDGSSRVLEIGCGSGRLMQLISEYCGEIHGADTSGEKIGRAHFDLADVPRAHAPCNSEDDLSLFADDYFDFVYFCGAFQNILSRDVVFGYLKAARRVLRENGILTFQVNGVPRQADADTKKSDAKWVRGWITGGDLMELAQELNCQVLALEGTFTQHMWFTWRKRTPGWNMRAGAAVKCEPSIVEGKYWAPSERTSRRRRRIELSQAVKYSEPED